jgi:uncharacterized protein with PQ loop repeat
MSIFEAGMLLCFGCAWPTSIYKSIKSKSTKGKSLFFLIIILLGYISGIIHKLMYSRDIVMALYILNACMVIVDMVLYFIIKKRENN